MRSRAGPLISLLALGACAPVQFARPFAGEPRAANFFDHDVPLQFADTNGRMLTFWGEDTEFIDGHSGYDFVLPEGTPLLAVEKATVQFAGAAAPFFCPLLKRTTQDLMVRLEMFHRGRLVRVNYQHMSRVDVKAGQRVAKGQVLGLSGNTGCSAGPHLHLEVFRKGRAGKLVPIDPYGFQGADPWETLSGARSEWLWAPAEAPALFRENVDTPNPNGSTAWVTITRIRWQGIDDQHHPNNEFVELTLDPRYAPDSVEMEHYTLASSAGEVFHFRPGFALTHARPTVRVYSGTGRATDRELYWGKNQGLWRNHPATDCATLTFPNGNRYTFYTGRVNTCPLPASPHRGEADAP